MRRAPRARRGLRRAVLLAWLAAPASARAAGPLGPEGAPIGTSDYTIDFYEGPVFAGSRVVGLAGAYVPIAEGVLAYGESPAAAATRPPHSVDWFDWELDGTVTLPSSVTGTDFDNNGDTSFANSAAFFLTGGAALHFGGFGIGLLANVQRYGLRGEGGATLFVDVTRVTLAAGYAFAGGAYTFGVGLGATAVDLARPDPSGGEVDLASVDGSSVHLGALFAPPSLPLRVGASLRLSADAPNAAPAGVEPDERGDFVAEGVFLPRSITLPAEGRVGVALQLFRPLNLRWQNPKLEGEAPRLARKVEAARARRAREVEVRLAELRERGESRARVERIEAALEAAEAAERAYENAAKDAAADRDRRARLEAYRRLPRERLLLSAALKVTAKTESGVGLESFLLQRVERSGEGTSFSPRLGVEGEAVPGWLVLRGGSYFESTRFRRGTDRVHATAGLDLRLPFTTRLFGLFDEATSFRVGGAVDLAARYLNWSVSAGIWR